MDIAALDPWALFHKNISCRISHTSLFY